MKQLKEVTRAIIINDEGKILIGRRARKDGIGLWALIGGKVDSGETPETCVIREVEEELAVSFSPLLWKEEIDNTSDPVQPWKVYYFTGKIIGEVSPKKDEITEVAYVSHSDFINLEFAFGHKRILQLFFAENFPS